MEQPKSPRPGGWDDGAGRDDNIYGSDFAYRMNQIEPARWNLYAGTGGAVLGALMACALFLFPGDIASDSVRLLIAFALGVVPISFFEKRAERSLKPARMGMAAAFGLGMVCFALYLLLHK